MALADELDALLPQTQCTQCGFAGCRPYAVAMAAGTAGPDRCPPGGHDGARRLARHLGVPEKPVDPRYGMPGPDVVALIDEAACIGCTLCIQACPVDAIVGAAKRMHTVLLAECTGCKLCLPPCPVDCITLVPVGAPPAADWKARPAHWRQRFENRRIRLVRARAERNERLEHKAAAKLAALPAEDPASERKRAIIEAALARARTRRATQEPSQ